MQKMVSIKSDALRYAREYYNVSLEDVCSKTKIKVEVLESYEKGDDFPSYAQLEKLASYYNRPDFSSSLITDLTQVRFKLHLGVYRIVIM